MTDDFDDVDVNMSDVDIPDIDLPDDDLPEEEIPESDEYHSSDDDESYENYGQHRNNNPTFKANIYTKKELSAKLKEADNQIVSRTRTRQKNPCHIREK